MLRCATCTKVGRRPTIFLSSFCQLVSVLYSVLSPQLRISQTRCAVILTCRGGDLWSKVIPSSRSASRLHAAQGPRRSFTDLMQTDLMQALVPVMVGPHARTVEKEEAGILSQPSLSRTSPMTKLSLLCIANMYFHNILLSSV